MIINRNRNFIDDFFDVVIKYLSDKHVTKMENYLPSQKPEIMRAVVLCSVARTLLCKPALSLGDVSAMRATFPALRETFTYWKMHAFRIWNVEHLLNESQLVFKFTGESNPKEVSRELTSVDKLQLAANMFKALPFKLQFADYEYDIIALVDGMTLYCTNPDVKAGIPADPATCVHEWEPESADNSWRSYCVKCETKAQGSCQG